MFTGIIEAIGEIKDIKGTKNGLFLTISVPESFDDLIVGDSVAVDGVCLTAKTLKEGSFSADVSAETIRKTTIGGLKAKSRVNLERALRLSDRLGGHIVTGHIDGAARLKEKMNEGESVRLFFSLDKELQRYVISKGSIAIDGISLTVNETGNDSFSVNIIPHTAEKTTLLDKRIGDEVNIEVDVIGKYVERLLLGKGTESKIDKSFLGKHGFL